MEKKTRIALLFMILALAALLRLPYADGSSSYCNPGELARDLAVLQEMREGYMPLVGPPSDKGDFFFGPAYYYATYPFAASSGFAPYSLALASMAFSLAAICMLWFLVRKWSGSAPLAYLTAFMLAISFLDIQFAKYGSNPNFIPFFVMLFMYSAWRHIEGRGSVWSAIAGGIGFGVAVQLHVVTLLAMPVLLLVLLLCGSLRPGLKSSAAFLLSVIAVNAPYLANELAYGFPQVRGLAEMAMSGGAGGGQMFNLDALAFRIPDIAGFWISTWISMHRLFNVIFILDHVLFIMLSAAVAIGFFVVFFVEGAKKRDAARPKKLILSGPVRTVMAVWFLVPTAILLMPVGSIAALFIFYFLVLIPLAYILSAYCLFRLYSGGWRLTASYIFAVYVVLQAVQLYIYHYEIISGTICL